LTVVALRTVSRIDKTWSPHIPGIAAEPDDADIVTAVSCWGLKMAAVLRHKIIAWNFGLYR
jgi:hypothetical protein